MCLPFRVRSCFAPFVSGLRGSRCLQNARRHIHMLTHARGTRSADSHPLPTPPLHAQPPPPRYVRNTTARAFSVVASALGIPALLPFLKAVCLSKKSWQARHTGIKIIQQIAILMGCAVLPHLKSMVDIIKHGLGVRPARPLFAPCISLSRGWASGRHGLCWICRHRRPEIGVGARLVSSGTHAPTC